MVTLGPTSDMIVAALLAISQLITPVPEAAVKKVEQEVSSRNSCQSLETQKKAFEEKNCEALKANRRKYRDDCQGIENEINQAEVLCATESEIPKVLSFKPRPLEQYMTMSNQDLVQELHLVCSALQDRVFLEPEEWMSGKTANRDDLSSKLVVLQKPELQDVFKSILNEAADGSFDAGVAYKVVTALCHWKVNRKAVAEQIDFTGSMKYLQELINELPRADHLPELPQASFVYDDKDQRIGEIYDREFVVRNGKYYIGKLSRRRTVQPEHIPTMLMNAFIAIEDKRFRQHNGFDFEALKRLYYGGVQGSTQGGSTFTMQLVKNAFFGQDVEKERTVGKRTLRRKLKEILMIPRVEAGYRKEQILGYYLNLISLTANAQGVLMASIDLFGKDDLNKLTLAEMALLAALPKGTSSYNPWRFPEAAKARRNLVLAALQDQGYITVAERDTASAEPLKLADRGSADQARIYSRFFSGHISNYFGTLKKKKLRDSRWTRGGFDIKTSFNLNLQKAVTNSVQQNLLQFEKERGTYKWQPWIDETTQKNMNVAARMAKPGTDIEEVFEALQVAHPYPETNWVVGLKTPKSSQWLLENGVRVPVDGADVSIFRSLKDYDAVVLDPQERGAYRLASGTKVQGAAVVLDVETGEVLALTGGFTAGAFGKYAQNNRITRSMRQPGSTIKPMSYLYALNHGVQPNQVLRNASVRFPKVENCPYKWSPKNYQGEGGSSVIVRTALEHSMNRPLVNLFVQMAGVPSSLANSGDLSDAGQEDKDKLTSTLNGIYDLAVAFGAYPSRDSLREKNLQQPCFPFVLGGFETTPLNMAQTYAAIANGGLKREAIFLRQVFKGDVPLLVDHTQEKRDQVSQYRAAVKQGFNFAPEAFGAIPGVTPASVAQLRSMMQGVLRRGTAQAISQWANLIGGKTGTTNDSRDVWFSGYNSKIAVVVWVGYDSSENLGNATGGSGALPIFRSIMESYYKMNPGELNDPLPLPTEVPGIVAAKVDLDSGRLYSYGGAAGSCKAPSSAIDEYLLESRITDLKRRCD